MPKASTAPRPSLWPALWSKPSPHTRKPVLAYPNSGEHYDAEGKVWTGACDQAAAYAEHAARWQAQGARMIGSCCRTGPDDIRAVRRMAVV